MFINFLDANDRLEWLHRAEARNRERFASIHHSEDALRTPAVPEDVASNLDVIGTQNPTTLNGSLNESFFNISEYSYY